jgi:O-antigen ligase
MLIRGCRIWSLTVIEILDRPWLGHGIEAVRDFGNWGRVRGHPHNGILQVWAEFGLVGILLFAAGLRGLLLRVGKSPLILQPVLLAGFVAWLVVFCVGYSNWQSWWMATAAALVMVFAAVERQMDRSL